MVTKSIFCTVDYISIESSLKNEMRYEIGVDSQIKVYIDQKYTEIHTCTFKQLR